MKRWIFTFGIGQQHERTCVLVVARTYSAAKKLMSDKYGLAWAFQYLERDYLDGCKESGLTPYPIIDEIWQEKKTDSPAS